MISPSPMFIVSTATHLHLDPPCHPTSPASVSMRPARTLVLTVYMVGHGSDSTVHIWIQGQCEAKQCVVQQLQASSRPRDYSLLVFTWGLNPTLEPPTPTPTIPSKARHSDSDTQTQAHRHTGTQTHKHTIAQGYTVAATTTTTTTTSSHTPPSSSCSSSTRTSTYPFLHCALALVPHQPLRLCHTPTDISR